MAQKIRLMAKILLPLLIVGIGLGIFEYFYSNKPQAQTQKRSYGGALVEVETLHSESRKVNIQSHGVVHAKEHIQLTARTSGVVQEISPNFIEGGFFQKGEVLLKVAPTVEANNYYTTLRAPFNGVVQSLDVSLGQYVNLGYHLGTLVGSDAVQVQVDLPLHAIAELPQARSRSEWKLPATVQLDYNHQVEQWSGTVSRNLMELSSQGMMAQLLITVSDPFRLKYQASEMTLPLFIGAFVDVFIPAQTYEEIFIIPAQALHEQNTVYLFDNGQLEIRPVSVAYRNKGEVFIQEGLHDGEQLIVSQLKGAAVGLKVRAEGQAFLKIADLPRNNVL